MSLGPDTDTDIRVADGAGKVALWGGAGDDMLSGVGIVNGLPSVATVLRSSARPTPDVLVGGSAGDALYGGDNDDTDQCRPQQRHVSGDAGTRRPCSTPRTSSRTPSGSARSAGPRAAALPCGAGPRPLTPTAGRRPRGAIQG